MEDEPDNIRPIYMRRLDAKMDRFIQGTVDVKRRPTVVEEVVVGLTHLVDRLDVRLDRIGRRLDLVDARL